MRKFRNILLLSLLLGMITLSFHQSPSLEAQRDLSNSVKWTVESVEYGAISLQIYRTAWQIVKARVANLRQNWAVVLDVDETVLSNAHYEKYIEERGLKYPEYWQEWVESRQAIAIPGARFFLDSVRTLGKNAHVVFITDRFVSQEKATIENLKAAGLWQEGDLIMCRRNKEDTKAKRREELMTGTGRGAPIGACLIIALFGDQLADFVEYPESLKNEDWKIKYQQLPEWGTRYFLLPNPMYGRWQRGY